MGRKSSLTALSFKAVTLLVSLIWLGAWSGGAMAAPAFQAAGTALSGTGAVSPAWPAHAIGDVALLFIESTGGQAATLSTPAGFVAVASSPQATGAGTAGTQITVFWARATSTSMAAPTVADPGDHVYAQIITYRGVINTGNPWDITGGGVKAVASTSVTVTGVTTSVPSTLIVQAVARDLDSAAAAFSAETNANLTGISERSDVGTTSGNGGGFAVWDGVMAAAGATGNTTATVTSSINAFLTIALKPPPSTVVSINRANPSPTSAATVSWTVTFSENVTGVDATAFTLAASGVSGAFITAVTGGGTTWTVTANTGIGSGTLGLNQTGPGSVGPILTGTFTGQVYTISATPALAEYRMDEASWNGTAGEVVDTSGTYHGQAFNSANTTGATPAIPANPGTCRYGVFDNGSTITQGYVALPGSFPNLTTDFAITAWIRSTNNAVAGQRILIDDQNNTGGYGFSLGDGAAGILRFFSRSITAAFLDSTYTIANNTWYFVAAVADITNGRRTIYVFNAAGALLNSTSDAAAFSGTWGTDAGPVSIGGETNASGEPPATFHFNGNIDEVRVYQKVLSQSALAVLATQTHACAGDLGIPGTLNAFETSTAAGAINGFIKTKVAGTAFGLDVVAITGGMQQGWFAGNVKVELLANTGTPGSGYGADNCPTANSVVQTIASAAISGGRSTVNFSAVANVFQDVRVRISFPTTSPTVTSCSTDSFAIRPNAFSNFSVSDTDWQTAGTGRALNDPTFGAITHKAGRPFSVRANAVNAAATPAITTNYTGSPTASLSACGGAACTASFGMLSLNTAFSAGQLVSDVATYDQVGSFSLQLVDSSFASIDSGDGSTAAERNIQSAIVSAGRFVPDHFAVAMNTPAFSTGCNSGPFTYVGQSFPYVTQPVITVTAQGASNNTTTLYTGNWWRITNPSLTAETYAALSGTLNTASVPNPDPVIAEIGGSPGRGTLTFSSGAAGSGFFFTRSTPVAPFNAEIGLSINVIDVDNVAYAANPARFGAATAGNGIAFSAGKEMRFGRLWLQNANGSELLRLPIPMETQHFNGTGFVTNTIDNCTTITNLNVGLGNFRAPLAAATATITPVAGAFVAGKKTITLSAPGAGNNGAVTVGVNLGSAATIDATSTCLTAWTGNAPSVASPDLSFLRGQWCGANYDRYPTVRATFGIYRNTDRFIYQQENY